jgi:hypothetical protein
MKKIFLVTLIILTQSIFAQIQTVDLENNLVSYITPNKDTIKIDFIFLANIPKKNLDSIEKSAILALIDYANNSLKFGNIVPKSFHPLFYRFEYKWKENSKHKYEVIVKYKGVNSFGTFFEETVLFKFNHKLIQTSKRNIG